MSVTESLIRTLRARPHLSAAELLAALGVSRATLMRVVRAAGPGVLAIGRARRTSYAARRLLRSRGEALPELQVDEQCVSTEVARLNLAYPDGSAFAFSTGSPWPLDDSMRDGWFD